MAHDILIVDDEADIRMLIAGILEDEGFNTRQASSDIEALAAVRACCPSLVILDIWLEGSRFDGLGILAHLKNEFPHIPVIMISGHGTIETAVSSIKQGAYDFIEKPFQADRLIVLVLRAIEAAHLKRENDDLRMRVGHETNLIGQSAAIQHIRQAVEKAAPTGSRVLITGPAGVGKDVVARLLHTQSRRSEGPFIVVNCAIMHPDRFERELFGIENKTNIDNQVGIKIGTFERAHTGTLFLDEIADMPIETQGKIVRVLQEQTFTRVGSNTPVAVDVRVIASSNRNLQLEMAAGRLREDLFYRLNVVPLEIPSLADRREDIPLFVDYFMNRSCNETGLPYRELGPDALIALQQAEWPGNVRQLRNLIDWLIIMASGDSQTLIRADQLPPEFGAEAPAVMHSDRTGEIMALPLREARELFEREYLLAQVSRFSGNISRTASFVGMERSALHRKLKSLGVHGNAKLGKSDEVAMIDEHQGQTS